MKKITSPLMFLLLMIISGKLMSQPSLTASVTTPPCNNNGVITVTATGLVPPISYTYNNWSGMQNVVHANMNSTIDNLINVPAYYNSWPGANTWYVSASDGVNTVTSTINVIPPFTFTIVSTAGTCPNPSTLQAINFVGGTGPFSYTYTNGLSNQNYYTNPALVPGGSYNAVVVDAAGCMVATSSATGAIYVNQVPSFAASASATNANCTNGAAAVSVSGGGVAPFSYLWNTSATSSAITGLVGGVYTCLVTDATGCAVVASTYVSQLVILSYTSVVTNATCIQNNGAIMSFVTGGTGPYSFNWSNAATTQNLSNLTGGNYTVQITDANGCLGWGSAYVPSSTPVNVTYLATASQCTNATGSATLTASGGTAPYSYVWYTFPTTNGPVVSNKLAGSYNFKVTDAAGCIRTGAAQIGMASNLSVNVNNVVAVCPSPTALMTANVVGTNGPFTYLWSNSATTNTIQANANTQYNCVVTDAQGCTAYDSGLCQNFTGINLGFSQTPPTCPTSPNGQLIATATGATGPYTYQWTGGPSANTISNIPQGWYSVVATAANGCSTSNNVYLASNNSGNCFCVVTGKVYQDANLNCVWNVGEPGIPNVAVHVPGVGYVYTDANGNYSINVPAGNYIITETVPQYYPLAACQSASQTLNVAPTANCTFTFNFAHGVIPVSDLRIATSNLNYAVPGSTYLQRMIISNEGSVFENNVKLAYKHDGQLGYNSSSPLTMTQPNTAVPTWYRVNSGFPTLSPGSSYVEDVNYNVPTNIPVGTQVNFKDTVAKNNPIPTNWLLDQTPWDNLCDHNTTVIAAYDPNFKEVSPAGVGQEGFIESKDSILTYVVHFQNTGNYFAQNVVVIDTLDASLRITSFKPGYSDHRYKAEMSDNGVVKFTFNGINLPWKSQYGDALSSGMFSYSVRMKKNLALGTKIKNRAFIYFDYNDPIITNTTLNTLRADANVGLTADEAKYIHTSASLYPNPTSDAFNLRFINKNVCNATFSLYDISGRELSSKQVSLREGENILAQSTSELNSGIYFVIVKTADFSIEKKLVVAK